jgi:uncharacterized protein YdeI (BOF family)|tara:strand:+ start:40549 stop:41208 length:660 start_codon:yes stop_codon:yes gene_type:complete
MLKKKILYTLMGATLLTPLASTAGKAETPLPARSDDADIVLTGTIGNIRSDEFDLKYSSGVITVELDELKWNGDETKHLRTGQIVTVSGQIDDDLFEGREIEADNIYVQDSSVYYYTNDVRPSYAVQYERDGADERYVSMQGTVSDISGNKFTITGRNHAVMQVDASDLSYDPFDDEGIKIKSGDRVHVYGEFDDGFFESHEIEADSIVILSQAGVTVQ